MELHKALRHIIQTEGSEIIKEIRLVNILDDFNAYKDIPAAKYIIRSLIAEGFTKKIIKIGEWNNEARQMMVRFISATGFNNELVETILKGMVYGLGWDNSEPVLEEEAAEVKVNVPSSSKHMKFMGIPITGSLTEFTNELKKKGFKKISNKRVEELDYRNDYGGYLFYASNYSYMKGRFSIFSNCLLQIVVSEYTGEVYSVSVLPYHGYGLAVNLSDYNRLFDMLVKKYGLPFPKPKDYPDDGKEYFILDEGSIVLGISGDEESDEIYSFFITYDDWIGSNKHEKKEKRKYQDDL